MPKKISERLFDRLKNEGYDVIPPPRRTRRGKIEVRLGFWSWYCHTSSGTGRIGSRDTMTACVKADKLEPDRFPWVDTEVRVWGRKK